MRNKNDNKKKIGSHVGLVFDHHRNAIVVQNFIITYLICYHRAIKRGSLFSTGYVTSTRNMSRDRARDKLFTWVDEESVFELPTYKGKL